MDMKFSTKKRTAGFSLVELVVVIAIMAVLMGILVPTLVRNVEKTKHGKDLSNLEEIRNAFQITMAEEPYNRVSGTITYKGSSFKVEDGIASNDIVSLIDPGKTLADFFTECIHNIDGDTISTFTLSFSSKLANPDTEVVFTFAGEKVSGQVISPKYGREDF